MSVYQTRSKYGRNATEWKVAVVYSSERAYGCEELEVEERITDPVP